MVGNVHLCFMVEDMKYSYDEISSRGLRFVGPPVEVTAGVNKGAYAIYMEGVDGILCEIFQGPPTKVG